MAKLEVSHNDDNVISQGNLLFLSFVFLFLLFVKYLVCPTVIDKFPQKYQQQN